MLHVPCFVRVPGKEGRDCDALTESIDLYPTLTEFCRVEPPEGLDGHSLLPLLQNPPFRQM